jgi:hypothetical protein
MKPFPMGGMQNVFRSGREPVTMSGPPCRSFLLRSETKSGLRWIITGRTKYVWASALYRRFNLNLVFPSGEILSAFFMAIIPDSSEVSGDLK